MGYTMKAQGYQIGLVGLAVMDRNLLFNMADHGHSMAGYDKDASRIEAMGKGAEGRDIRDVTSSKEFVALFAAQSRRLRNVALGCDETMISNIKEDHEYQSSK